MRYEGRSYLILSKNRTEKKYLENKICKNVYFTLDSNLYTSPNYQYFQSSWNNQSYLFQLTNKSTNIRDIRNYLKCSKLYFDGKIFFCLNFFFILKTKILFLKNKDSEKLYRTMKSYFHYNYTVLNEENLVVPLLVGKSFGPSVLLSLTQMGVNEFSSVICEKFARSQFIKSPIKCNDYYGIKSNGIQTKTNIRPETVHLECRNKFEKSVDLSRCKFKIRSIGYKMSCYYFFCGRKINNNC